MEAAFPGAYGTMSNRSEAKGALSPLCISKTSRGGYVRSMGANSHRCQMESCHHHPHVSV